MTAILIIHHNTVDDLERLLFLLGENSSANDKPYVIVVDTASTDPRARTMADTYPWARFVFQDENSGYSTAVNRGLKEIAEQRILLVNADILITAKQLRELEKSAERLNHPTVISPLHCYEDGSPQVTWGDEPGFFSEWQRRRLTRGCISREPAIVDEVLERAKQTSEVDWVSGSCLLIDRSQPGGKLDWDETYELYFEDIDWCHRVREAGGRIVFTSEVTVEHRHGASMKQEPVRTGVIYRKSQVLYAKKFHGRFFVLSLRIVTTIGLVGRWLRERSSGESGASTMAQIRALWD